MPRRSNKRMSTNGRVDRKQGGKMRSVPSPATEPYNNTHEQQTGRLHHDRMAPGTGGPSSGGRRRTRGGKR